MPFVTNISYSTIEIIDCLVPGTGQQTGRTIYEELRDFTPTGVPRVKLHYIASEAEFWACLSNIEADCLSGWKPIIHIEAHGCQAGLEVSNSGNQKSSIVPWNVLVDRFRGINVASDFNLGVFVAACEGIEAVRPMTIKKPAPYMFLVGPKAPLAARELRTAAKNFYHDILTGEDLNTAFSHLPRIFNSFLAQRFFAITYARVLKRQSVGRRRIERVNSLVNMVLPADSPPAQLRKVRDMAKLFSRPDRDRFKAVQGVYLPGGVCYDFDELVDMVRAGKIPD